MKHFASLICLFLFCLVPPANLLAQERLLFHDCSDGLSQNSVVSIVQDNQGFLWVATRYGLNRYDGHTYEHFDIQDGNPSPTKSNQLTSLAYDKKHNDLWVGSYGGGLIKINLDSYQWSYYNSSEHFLTNNQVTTLYIDQDNLLWVSTENEGIYIYQLDDLEKPFSSPKFDIAQFDQEDVTIITGSNDLILMGTWSSGLIILNKTTGIVRTLLDPNIPVRSIVAGTRNEFYLGTNSGLKKMVVQSSGAIEITSLIPELNNSVILSLLIDKESKLFIGTENEGLYTLIDGQTNKYVSNSVGSNQISGNSIWSLYEDNSGLIWIGLFMKGLNKVDKLENKFKKIQRFQCNNEKIELDLVNALVETENDLWIGTDGNGLYAYNHVQEKFKCHDFGSLGRQQAITSIVEGDDHKLWVGTWKEGIIKYDFNNEQYEIINSSGPKNKRLSGNFIYDLHKDRNDNIWASCFDDGLDVFSRHQLIKSFDKHELISRSIRVITENCAGDIVLGTEQSGIQILDVDENYNIINTRGLLKIKNSNFGYSINAIKLDSACNMWVATSKGLICINDANEQLKQYTTKDGLPSNYIASLEFDSNGLLWGTTNQGIFSFDISNERVHSYGLQDGLLSNEFLVGSSVKTKNGDIYFGNNAGVNYYPKGVMNINEKEPPVVITKIRVSGNELDSLNKPYKYFSNKNPRISFKYQNNDLAFKFTSINFSQSELNQFKIRLKGLENDWQTIGNKREIEYRNLHPGNYTFQVMGSNNDLVWNNKPSEFKFSIAKPWYNSLVAWLIYTLLFCLIVFYVFRSFLTRFQLKEKLRVEQTESEKLKELAKLRSQFFANISHELITPLTMIISPLKGIENSEASIKPENARVMLSNAERLMNYINQILNLTKLESNTIKLNVKENNFTNFLKTVCLKFAPIATSKGLTLKFIDPGKSLFLFYDEEKMEQVISNLLSNAIKYAAKKGQIMVKVEEASEEIIVIVMDDGLGIEEKSIHRIFDRYFRENENELIASGIGIGLSIVKELVDLHKGKISVESKKDQFTTFQLAFKKGKGHFKNADLNDSIAVQNAESSFEIAHHEAADMDNEFPVVLLVEDNPDIAQYIVSYLKDSYQILWAKDGVEGLEYAISHIPDVIISDVMMPFKDGYQLCQDLKTNELTNHISIILLTVKSSEESQIAGYEHGADFYMTKPFTPQLLKLRIDNIIKHNQEIAVKLLKGNLQNETLDKQEFSELDQLFLERARDIVLKNLNNSHFTVSDLANGMKISKGQLYRKLKSILNQSTNLFIRTVRLNQAAKLLSEGQYNISEITYKVGFNDLKYFRSCFKKQFGQTPSDYRSQKTDR